ncbi:aminotransferase DegT [Litchfieldella qijiaojingensis]|uniref:Aminotransferase DegT n=1 Tax=Litchfieldella qijiaojingensis TaxID=980347 RepID=A0ABQ2ZGB0_9GAMM|nr:aminotransferase class I/II-fold pyridoxal phosphate-dependent enzyme [Halomonas qijiaojingensis]GGY11756.1 aminotransferase DegT [Halomonas qijiaojingensis]
MNYLPGFYTAESIPEAVKYEVLELLESGELFRYSSESESSVSRLEMEFAELMDMPFALAVSSCSSALFLSLKAIGLEPGSKVMIPAFTFSAVPSAVVHAGCVPVLVNVADNYRIEMEEFEQKLSEGIDAVIVSHMRGHISDMDAIVDLCEERGVPIIEDAAHALGATWSGRKIGTIGQVGCFSFQSYKLINAGEGGILVTRDVDIIARAVLMSGAYEHNWKKHPKINHRFTFWQNKLPLFNMRMSNLTAAVAGPQIREVSQRVKAGQANYDYVAKILNASDWLHVPSPLEKEVRAPDSIQFNLCGFDSDEDAKEFQRRAGGKGAEVQIFGLSEDNARAFWNWKFIHPQNDLSPTRNVLVRACDVRLPVNLSKKDLDLIASALVESVREVKEMSCPVDYAYGPEAQ